MTVAFDAASTKAITFTTNDSTWSHGGAASNVKGVIVYVVIAASNTPPVGVTYGGVALTKIAEANDTVTETGNATAWFLGASVPQGTQTVAVDVGAAQIWIGAAITVTGAANMTPFFGTQQENAANPSIAVVVPNSRVNYSSGAYFTGATAPIGAGAGHTAFGGVDRGNDAGEFLRLTTGTTAGNVTVATATAATDDLAFVAVAITEIAANTVTHTASPVVLTGGAHTRAVGRAHTAGNLALTGGADTKALTRAHAAGVVTVTGGADTKASTRAHSAGSIALAGGADAKTSGRAHTAGVVGIAGGAHTVDYVPNVSSARARVSWVEMQLPLGTPSVANSVTLTSGSIVLTGSASTRSRTKAESAGVLALTGGAQTLARSRAHTAGQLVLAGGAQTRSTAKSHAAGLLAFAGGTHTARITRTVALSAGQIVITGGTDTKSRRKAHSAGSLVLAGGAHSATGGNTVSVASGQINIVGGTHTVSAIRARTVSLSSGSITLLSGTHTKTRTSLAAAGSLVLSGGTPVVSRGQYVTASAAQLVIASGSHEALRLKNAQLTSGAIVILGGTAQVDVDLTYKGQIVRAEGSYDVILEAGGTYAIVVRAEGSYVVGVPAGGKYRTRIWAEGSFDTSVGM